MKPKLVALDVTKIFVEKASEKPVIALKDLSLEIPEGKLTCLIGPSGCGKTTFLNIVAGFIKPDKGKVLLDGKDISGPSSDRAVVFQEFALFEWLTVRKNIAFGLENAREMKGLSKHEKNAKTEELIRLVGLRGFENRYPVELSGGMKQRVGVARALAIDPEILLMDEPFGSLDAQTRRIMQEELIKILNIAGKTVLFVTHSIDEAIYLSDKIVVLTARPGRVKMILVNDLPRPRSRSTEEYYKMYRTLDETISEEVQKSMKEMK